MSQKTKIQPKTVFSRDIPTLVQSRSWASNPDISDECWLQINELIELNYFRQKRGFDLSKIDVHADRLLEDVDTAFKKYRKNILYRNELKIYLSVIKELTLVYKQYRKKILTIDKMQKQISMILDESKMSGPRYLATVDDFMPPVDFLEKKRGTYGPSMLAAERMSDFLGVNSKTLIERNKKERKRLEKISLSGYHSILNYEAIKFAISKLDRHLSLPECPSLKETLF